VLRVLLAALVGAVIAVSTDRMLPGLFGLEPIAFDRPLGTLPPEPPAKAVFAQLILLHLVSGAVAGAVAAAIAPAGRRLPAAAAVAFLASLAAALTGVLVPVGPDWYHLLHFATTLIAPPLGARLVARGGPESEALTVRVEAQAPDRTKRDPPHERAAVPNEGESEAVSVTGAAPEPA
jgi:hypothetical protein